MRLILSASKYDVAAGRISDRIHCFGRLRCAPIRMDSHAAEVMIKARLKESARLLIERLPGRMQDLMHNPRHIAGVSSFALRVASCALQRPRLPLFLTGLAFAARGVLAAS